MAYDEELAERIRGALAAWEGVSERKMFGGIGFMVGGNMACGVSGDEMIVRLAPDDADAALEEPEVREFEGGGRPMRGWILVAPAATADDESLAAWVTRGADFAASLPPK
ncbi:MAG TPA: TfoX/Sxy family protein [Miltoncostaeaceae bacterium]|nr:TfoX/Sxy family protein [Miltoncostaeaceae bacterium]